MNIAKYIDHTILNPDARKKDVKKICEEAKENKFYSVCVNGVNVAYACDQLKATDVKLAAVVGFPLGAMTSETKVFETKDAIKNGAQEIDMVINIGALKENNREEVYNDIKAVVEAAHGKAIVKVIIENSLLTKEEKVLACQLAKKAGAEFVKTSTGFSRSGATIEDIKLMRETLGPNIGIKASGGVRDFKTAKDMIDAGATRIGASASVAIVNR